MLISAKALLDRNPSPDEDEIRLALSGNLCRCTGYSGIVRAVQAAAAQLAEPRLGSQAARGHRPDRLDPAVAHREQLVAEVDRGADVGGMKRDPLAHRHRP